MSKECLGKPLLLNVSVLREGRRRDDNCLKVGLNSRPQTGSHWNCEVKPPKARKSACMDNLPST